MSVGVCVLVVLGIIVASEAVQNCIDDYQHHYASQRPDNGLAILGFVLGAGYRCVGVFIHENGEALTALFTLTLSSVTAFLAYYTYHLWAATGKLAREAKEGTDKTLAHLEDTAKRQLRAYVSLERFAIRRVSLGPAADALRWDIAPVFQNTGATPANDFRLAINYEERSDDLPSDFDFPDLPSAETPSVGSIGPRCHATAGSIEVPYKQVGGLLGATKRLFIWGWAEYKDVFPDSPSRRVEFAGEVEATSNPRGIELRVASLDRHNHAT